MDVAMLQIKSAPLRAGAHSLSAPLRAGAHSISAPLRAGALNNETISSPVPAEWGMATRSLAPQWLWLREQWRLLAQTLRLPDTWQSFLLFTLAIVLVCGGLVLHLQLSTIILQDTIALRGLQAEEQVIQKENANLVWAIAQETDLNRVMTRATELGYEPAFQRNYVIIPGTTVAQVDR
jgi:hypothetical protein